MQANGSREPMFIKGHDSTNFQKFQVAIMTIPPPLLETTRFSANSGSVILRLSQYLSAKRHSRILGLRAIFGQKQ